MFSWGTKALFGLAVAAFVASFGYGIATSEGSGAAALGFVAAGAAALGLATVSVGPDRAPVPSADGPLPQVPPAGGRRMFPSVFPVAVAVAVAVMVIGVATTVWVVVPAAIVAVLMAVGWMFQSWTEHPAFTTRFGHRLSDRLVAPLGVPLAVFALVLVITFSLSRILLAVSENGARGVALGVAVIILAGAFFVASQERMARAALSTLVVVALLSLVGAGVAGWAHGLRHQEVKGAVAGAPAIPIATQGDNLAFNTSTLAFPADKTVPLVFDNQSHGIPHNVGIYDAQGGKELFRGAIVTGPKQVTYRVAPLAAGTYYFQCDVHPSMHGTLVVTAGTTTPGGSSVTGSSVTGSSVTGSSVTTTPAPATTATSLLVQTGFATTPATAGS